MGWRARVLILPGVNVSDDKQPAPSEHRTREPRALSASDVGDAKWRRWIGYGSMLLGVVLMGVLFGFARADLVPPQPVSPPVPPPESETLALARFATHAVVTVAGAWFCYQVLRAGERMALPTWALRSTRRAQVLLGMRSPPEEIGKQFAEFRDTVMKALPAKDKKA